MKKIDKEIDVANQLFLLVDRHLSSVRRRNVSYVMNSLSSKVLAINLYVSGTKGVAQMLIVLLKNKNNKWEVHSPLINYELSRLHEIAVVTKYLATRLRMVVGKF